MAYRQRQRDKMEQNQKDKEHHLENRQAVMLSMAKLHLDEGLSYAEIGRRFNLTRQRVHQLLKEFSDGPVADQSPSVADLSTPSVPNSLNTSEESPSFLS